MRCACAAYYICTSIRVCVDKRVESFVDAQHKKKKQTMSHSLYSSSKIAVEFEDEEGLQDLCLELRELEAEV